MAAAPGAGVGPVAGVGLGCGTDGVGLGCGVAGVGLLAGCDDGSAGLEDRNASDLPSGLQRGELEDCGLVVNCHGGREPSVATIQIEDCLRFWARSIFVTTYATSLPSGEICGSLTNSKAK